MAIEIENEIDEKLWNSIRSSFTSQNYTNAILDAIKFLFTRLRDKTSEDADGQELVRNVVKQEVLNFFIPSADEKSITAHYDGLKNILNGLFQFYRNPRDHKPELYTEIDNRKKAEALVLFINQIAILVNDSTTTFSKEKLLRKISNIATYDGDFKYNSNEIMRIPGNLRYSTFIFLYKDQISLFWNKEVIDNFFIQLLDKIEKDEEKKRIYKEISSDCEEPKNISFILFVMKILGRNYEYLDYNSKLTCERFFIKFLQNYLLLSAEKEGNEKYLIDEQGNIKDIDLKYFTECIPIISKSVFTNFHNKSKQDIQKIVFEFLNSENEKFAAEYLLAYLPALGIEPLYELISFIRESLVYRDRLYYNSLLELSKVNEIPSNDLASHQWMKYFIEEMKNFESGELTNA